MAALVALGLFSVVGTYRWIRKQEFSLVTGPAILGVVALLGAVGPWGASNVSQLSQLDRLETALAEQDMLDASGKVAEPEVVRSKMSAIHSNTVYEAAKYLLDAHGPAAFAELTDLDLSTGHTYEQLAILGFDEMPLTPSTCTFEVPYDEAHFLLGGGHVSDFSASRSFENTHRGFTLLLENNELTVSGMGKRGVANLSFPQVAPPFDEHVETLEKAYWTVPILDASGTVIGTIAIRQVSFEARGDDVDATYATGLVQLK